LDDMGAGMRVVREKYMRLRKVKTGMGEGKERRKETEELRRERSCPF
jgi:hypothetical protein